MARSSPSSTDGWNGERASARTATSSPIRCRRSARRASVRAVSRDSLRSPPLSAHAAVGRNRDALLEQALPHEVLEGCPGAPAGLEEPVDLPLGQHRRAGRRTRLGPVRELRQAPEAPGELGALLDRPLEALLPHRHLEAGLPERLRQRAERVPVERLRRDPPAALVEVAGGRRAT